MKQEVEYTINIKRMEKRSFEMIRRKVSGLAGRLAGWIETARL